jgi:small GTP-binding protein
MGASLGKSEVRVLIAGLDSAGKTTVLLKLKRGEKRKKENISTTPTLHFNTEQWKFKNRTFGVWDVGGQDAIRQLWRHHLTGTQALVYVIDSNDRERLEKAAQEMHRVMLDHAMRDACLLIYANKCDLPHALGTDEITECLKLKQLGARAWHVQRSCATTGEGLWEGLEWLATHTKPL